MSSKRKSFNRLAEDGGTSSGEMRLEDFDSGKRRRYVVKDEEGDNDDIVCNKPLTGRDYACIGVGVVVLVIAAGLFIVLGVALQPKPKEGDRWEQVRLPRTVIPQTYNLHLVTNLPSLAVAGSVAITAVVNDSTKFIIFHAKDMSVANVSVRLGDQAVEVNRIFNYSENDFMIIELSQSLSQNDAITISMNFNYTLRNDLVGFYNSSYIMDGQTHVLATTQFEPTDARRAFPCFDEPALKANFTISITHPSEYTAVSNMPATDTRAVTKDSKVTTSFVTSYRMSTYLVAFVVSDFKCSSPDTTASGVKVGIAITVNCNRVHVI